MPLTKDDLAKLSFKLEKFNTETNKWEVYGNYGNIPYSKLKPLEETPGDDTPGGDTPGEEEQYDIFTQTVLKNLGLGTYRITESGNSDIKQNHAGSEAYVKYVWEDNTDGTGWQDSCCKGRQNVRCDSEQSLYNGKRSKRPGHRA